MSSTLCNKCSKRIAGEKIRCPLCLKTFHPGCAKAYVQFRSASNCCINSLSACPNDYPVQSGPTISTVSHTGIATHSSTPSSETSSTMSASDATLNLLVAKLTNFIEQQTATNERQSATLSQITASLAILPELKQAVNDHTTRLDQLEHRMDQLEHRIDMLHNNVGEVNPPSAQFIPAVTSELIIAGIPPSVTDAPEPIARKVFNALGVSNLICDILSVRPMRIPSLDRPNVSLSEPDVSATARSRSFVITLKSHSVRDFIINKKRMKRNLTVNEVFSINAFGLVYVNELLPPATYKLLRRTKEMAAETGHKHVWVRSGSIFARRDIGQPVINITSDSDLSKLV